MKIIINIIVYFSILISAESFSQIIALDKDETLDEKRTGWLPYAFSTDSLDTTVGIGGGVAGTIQPQTSLFGTAFVSANDSALISGAFNNYRLGESRVFTDVFVLANHFTDQRFYADLDNDPTDARAGSNDQCALHSASATGAQTRIKPASSTHELHHAGHAAPMLEA